MTILVTLGVVFSFTAALILGWAGLFYVSLSPQIARALLLVGRLFIGLYVITVSSMLVLMVLTTCRMIP